MGCTHQTTNINFFLIKAASVTSSNQPLYRQTYKQEHHSAQAQLLTQTVNE
jgi:hypothetical protein